MNSVLPEAFLAVATRESQSYSRHWKRDRVSHYKEGP